MDFDKSTAEILATILAAIVMAFVMLRRRRKAQDEKHRIGNVTNLKQ